MLDLSETTPLLHGEDNPLNKEKSETRDWNGPDGLLTRIVALILMSVVGFGAFFCFDNPGALQTEVHFLCQICILLLILLLRPLDGVMISKLRNVMFIPS